MAILLFSELRKMQGKDYTFELFQDKPVPEDVLNLWRQRRFNPIVVGIAIVTYPGKDKKYTFPAYFKIPSKNPIESSGHKTGLKVV